MTGEVLGLLKDWGSAGAVIASIILFLRHLRERAEKTDVIMANHLDHVSQANKQAARTNKQAAALMAEALDRLHEHCGRQK